MNIYSLIATSSSASRCCVAENNMERKTSQEIPVESTSFASAGCGAGENFPKQEVVVADERDENCIFALPLPPWHHWQQTPHAHVDFLTTRSPISHVRPARDMPVGVLLPVSSMQSVKGESEFHGEILNNNLGKVADSNQTDSSDAMDASKAKASSTLVFSSNDLQALINPSRALCSDKNDMLDGENSSVQMARHLNPSCEGEHQMKLSSIENLIYAQNHALVTPQSIEDGSSVCQASTVTVAIPGLPSRQGVTTPSSISNRLRRARISKSFKALRELFPHSIEGNRVAILDDIIDYVKCLQFQIRALSQRRLGGEAAAESLIHLEGIGNHLLHPEMLSEPLEGMIGRLMEVNMLAATQLLESKGLCVMPMAMAGVPFEAR